MPKHRREKCARKTGQATEFQRARPARPFRAGQDPALRQKQLQRQKKRLTGFLIELSLLRTSEFTMKPGQGTILSKLTKPEIQNVFSIEHFTITL